MQGDKRADPPTRATPSLTAALESVELLSLTPYSGLPPSARDRLRLTEGQANALIRLGLRPLDRTLTDREANRIRDFIYLALHEGPVAELITR